MKQFLRILVSIVVSSILFLLISQIFKVFSFSDVNLPSFLNSLESGVVINAFIIFFSIVVGFLFFFFFSNIITDRIFLLEKKIEDLLVNMNTAELISSIFGCLIGLFIANLIGLPISRLSIVGVLIVIILNVILGFLGFQVAFKRKDDFKLLFSNKNKHDKNYKISGRPKVLDTSVIIDGRILDILLTGFIEGKIIIPNFVLEELRHIADSSDSLKRNRGRRGLDILNEIQKQTTIPVEIVQWDSNDQDEVDTKLLKLGKKLDAFVVTNDFNLNKVAEFQKVSVLNINDLSRSVKTVILPGETINVSVIKDGKENKQGIGYLDDGTMIVIEGGSKYIGEIIGVTVTSVLQTSAGKMIFAKAN